MLRFQIPETGVSLEKRLAKFGTALILPAAIVGCESVNQAVGSATGGTIGGAAGAYVGREVGGEHGAVIGAAAGAALGSLIGGEIGRQLDEQDRQLASAATAQALEGGVGSTSTWESENNPGVSGGTEIVSRSQNASGAQCSLANERAVIRGREVTQKQEYCKGSEGWIAT